MKKAAPYLLSLFLLMCANVAIAVNPSVENEADSTIVEAKKKSNLSYRYTLFDFLQPFINEEKSLP